MASMLLAVVAVLLLHQRVRLGVSGVWRISGVPNDGPVEPLVLILGAVGRLEGGVL